MGHAGQSQGEGSINGLAGTPCYCQKALPQHESCGCGLGAPELQKTTKRAGDSTSSGSLFTSGERETNGVTRSPAGALVITTDEVLPVLVGLQDDAPSKDVSTTRPMLRPILASITITTASTPMG